MKTNKLIIDATGGVMGRIVSYVAKQALLGKEIAVVNCNEALLTGRKSSVIHEYQVVRAKGSANQKGPFFPKSPERIMKRTLRGMLSYKQGRGKEAFDRVKFYNHVPPELESAEKVQLVRNLKTKAIKMSQLMEVI